MPADLYVDCSGPAAVLLASMPGFAMADWSGILPTRRVLLGKPQAPQIALEDSVTRIEGGWIYQVNGRDAAYRIAGCDDAADEDAIRRALGVEPAVTIALQPGRVVQPWIGNVVAIGDAAARFEPIGPFNFDMAQQQIALLVEMLPGRRIEPLERAEYNRRSALMMDGARDMAALPFAASRAGQFASVDTSDGWIANAIDQFARRGRIPFREEMPLSQQEIAALMVAVGLPAGMPPALHDADQAVEQAAKAEFDRRAAAALEFAPPYAQWLAANLR